LAHFPHGAHPRVRSRHCLLKRLPATVEATVSSSLSSTRKCSNFLLKKRGSALVTCWQMLGAAGLNCCAMTRNLRPAKCCVHD
jgi:hypothetical protein